MGEYGSDEHKAEWLEINTKYYESPKEAEIAWFMKLKLEANPPQSAAFFMSQDIHYQSPIDGKVISGKRARQEDLARSGCIEYDPEMKTDYSRRIERDEKSLDSKIEQSVEMEMAKMPARKREGLVSELNSGVEVDVQRLTA